MPSLEIIVALGGVPWKIRYVALNEPMLAHIIIAELTS